MSSIGTGVATSVAQVAQNAQQAGKARDKARADVHRTAQQAQLQRVARLRAPGAALDPDAELPDRQAPGYEQLYFTAPDGQPLPDPHDPDDPPHAAEASAHDHMITYGPHAEPTFPLYQHLDVRG